MKKIIINDDVYKQYCDNYYINKNGDIYSTKSNKFLKHYIDVDGYHRVDIHKKHKKVHRLVYIVWKGPIPKGKQINHKDDNKNNNHIDNLYLGNQKQNMIDKSKNNKCAGNLFYLVLMDKNISTPITFCPASDFIEYCGHPCKNKSIKRMFNKNWFKKRYIVIKYARVKNLNEIESVTTMCDEFSTVE